MAKLLRSACCFIATLLLMDFALPSLQLTPSRRSFSLQLHLHPPPSYLHNLTSFDHFSQQPLIPHLFTDEPLFHFDVASNAYLRVGSARGLYLADPAPSLELRHLFFTATLPNFPGRQSTSREAEGGSLVMMGSVDSGVISVIGGIGSFVLASGQAKVAVAAECLKSVAMAAECLESEQHSLRILLDVELQYEEHDCEVALV